MFPDFSGAIDKISGAIQQHKIKSALATYATDPTGAVNAVMAHDPELGMRLGAYHDQEVDRQAQLAAQNLKNHQDVLSGVAGVLRPTYANKGDLGAAFDAAAPLLKSTYGLKDEELPNFRDAFTKNPGLIDALDPEYNKTNVVDGAIVRNGKVIYQSPGKPVVVGAEQRLVVPDQPGQGVAPAAAPGAAPGKLDGTRLFQEFTGPHEGGYNPHDANGSPTNFGINQSANPGVDVSKLTKEQAAQIFNDKYYNQSGAPDLPAPLAAVHGDTSFINPGRAQQFLQQSGGDYNKYMQLRSLWMSHLVHSDPAKYAPYAKAWANRNRDLSAYAQHLEQGNPAGTYAASAPGAGANGVPTLSGGVAAPTGYHVAYSGPGKPGDSVRAATPAELQAAGYPTGTGAQIDGNGKFLNIKTPTTQYQKDLTANSPEHFQSTLSQLQELRSNLRQLRDSKDLPSATGTFGTARGIIPGTHIRDLHALTQQINSQKLIALVSALREGGGSSPFSRITNNLATLLPTSLAPTDFSQSTEGFKSGINRGLRQLNTIEAQLIAGARKHGILNSPGDGGAGPSASGHFTKGANGILVWRP